MLIPAKPIMVAKHPTPSAGHVNECAVDIGARSQDSNTNVADFNDQPTLSRADSHMRESVLDLKDCLSMP